MGNNKSSARFIFVGRYHFPINHVNKFLQISGIFCWIRIRPLALRKRKTQAILPIFRRIRRVKGWNSKIHAKCEGMGIITVCQETGSLDAFNCSGVRPKAFKTN
jgi:hypothetical protein